MTKGNKDRCPIVSSLIVIFLRIYDDCFANFILLVSYRRRA